MEIKKRSSGIELLRIVSMVMIVTLHTLGKGRALGQTQVGTKEFACAQIIEAFCIVAVNCYIWACEKISVNTFYDN